MNINYNHLQHKVFDDLKYAVDFYKALSFGVMMYPKMETKRVLNIDTYIFSSIQGTLDSIQTLLELRRINDSYALLRKYSDIAAMNIYSNLVLESEIEEKSKKDVISWLSGKGKLPEYKEMIRNIIKSKRLEHINKIIKKDDRYQKIRSYCNDHVHYNRIELAFQNDNEIMIIEPETIYDRFRIDFIDIFIFHVSYILSLQNIYMMASDYIDYIECGMTPEPGMEYLVAPYIEEFFVKYLSSNRPDILDVIKDNTEMKICT